MSLCCLCPRRCAADRTLGEGRCRSPETPCVARAAPHFGEEPCISGARGSGAVFFTGCSLGCVFCQNMEISRGHAGTALTAEALAEVFLRLRDTGVHNINLVTGSHYVPAIAEALSRVTLGVPVVWNSSGYETPETLRMLDGLVSVYMPDFKFSDAALAEMCCNAPDYPQTALGAIREMYRQTGTFELDGEGMLTRGVLIRHLILPGHAENTLGVIDMIEDNLPARNIMFSLMAQYTPPERTGGLPPELRARVSEAEYRRCADYLDFSEIEYGYYQGLDSATDELLPAFDGTGVGE